jgi:hypothetical protein
MSEAEELLAALRPFALAADEFDQVKDTAVDGVFMWAQHSNTAAHEARQISVRDLRRIRNLYRAILARLGAKP